jgi:tellurite resistance protein
MGFVARKRRAAERREEQRAELKDRTLAGMVEAGLLMAAADGELADEEWDTVTAVIDGFFDGNATRRQIEEIMDDCWEAFERDGYDARMEAMAENLQTPELRELGLQVAAAVMLADGEYAEGEEDEAYFDMADTLEIPRRRAEAILDEVAEQYDM